MKILIIDDEYTIRHGIATVIRKYNERWTIVGEASDVSQALSIIRQERPDVIFLDIKMPGKSGIDLLREIQEIPLKMIPVIISGYSDFVYAQQALRYGAFDYIMKPVSPGKIIDVLCKLEKKIISDQFLADELEAYHKSKEDRKIQFIQNLIYGYTDYNRKEKENLDLFDLSGKCGRVVTALIKQDGDQTGDEKNNSAVIRFLDFFRNIGLECYPIGIGLLSISVLVIFNDNTCAEDFGNIENSLECLTGAAENCIAVSEICNDFMRLQEFFYDTLSKLREASKIFQETTMQEDPIIAQKDIAPLIRQTIFNIQQRYQKDISLDTLAKLVFIHPIYLSDLFKKETGMNISHYITLYRIQKAKELLRDLQNKVYDIAYQTGFNDARYFSQVFKKETGLTPTQYREKFCLDSQF